MRLRIIQANYFYLTLIIMVNTAFAESPNILFILSDNQSYYEMSCHGHATVQTPNIDRLASQSLDFQNFHAPPFCSPSRSVIMTGRYAMKTGVYDTRGGRSILHMKEKTIADILKENGYKAGIFGKWHLGSASPYLPSDRGFDEIFIHGGGGVGQLEDHYGNTLFNTVFTHNSKIHKGKGYCTDVIFNQAMKWVQKVQKGPFFCFISTPVTHAPHYGPKKLVQQLKQKGVQGNIELFAQIQNLDTNIGRLLKKLDTMGLNKNTIVIFASDQGMNDRGAPHGENRLGFAYDPAHHVPFMLRAPGCKSGVSRELTGMIDFFPTILELCNIPTPEYTDGLSLKPLLTDETDFPSKRTLVIQCPRGRDRNKWLNSSVKQGPWRLVNGKELYNVSSDPRQKTDLAALKLDIVQRLQIEYEKFWESIPTQDATLARHIIGDSQFPEITLNGMDWYLGSKPWSQSQFSKRKGNGKWAISVKESGNYLFECRFFPKEADKSMSRTKAKLQIGNLIKEKSIRRSDKSATFEIHLKAGDYDLKSWLTSDKADTGALFVYVKKAP